MEADQGKNEGENMSRNEKQYEEMLKRMEKEAVKELLHYHERDWRLRAKSVIKKAAGRYVPPVDVIFWPTGLIANALAENLNAWQDREAVICALRTYFDRWISKGMPLYCVDDLLCGVALLILYEETGEEKYRTGTDKMAEFVLELAEKEADGAGSIPYRPAQKNKHIYVDGIGMICPFLCRYGVTFRNALAVDTALLQIENMIKYGMDEKTGLPYHGFLYENRIKYGIIGWGRAVGWLLMGMAGVLGVLTDEKLQELESYYGRRNEIIDSFRTIMGKAVLYQKEKGAFSWQLQALEGPNDSSAAAMIASAVVSALEYGILDCNKEGAAYLNVLEKAAEYLADCEHKGRIYECSGECGGFSQYPQVYGAYPWSLGAAVRVIPCASHCIADENKLQM